MPTNLTLRTFASTGILVACAACSPRPAAPAEDPSSARPAASTASASASTPPPQSSGSPAADAAMGNTTFFVFESYLSPTQQPGEESDAPKLLEKATGLQSTAPSVPREQRKSLGHGQIRFAKNLSRAYVEVNISGVNPADILMFHVHCGPPGVLGPIIVDFSEFGSLTKNFETGKFTAELSNKNISFIKDMPHGLKPALPESCPAEIGFLPTQAMTIAAMEYLARKGVLYFNLHTKANTFYGEMRGQIYPAKE